MTRKPLRYGCATHAVVHPAPPARSYAPRACQTRTRRMVAIPCLLAVLIVDALHGARAQQVVATHGDMVTVAPQTFSTTDPGPAGTILYAEGTNPSTGAPSTINATSVNIFTIGDQAYGVDAENGAHVTLNSSTSNGPFTISTSGNNASGIVARGVGTLVTADGVVFRTSSLSSRGFDAVGG